MACWLSCYESAFASTVDRAARYAVRHFASRALRLSIDIQLWQRSLEGAETIQRPLKWYPHAQEDLKPQHLKQHVDGLGGPSPRQPPPSTFLALRAVRKPYTYMVCNPACIAAVYEYAELSGGST